MRRDWEKGIRKTDRGKSMCKGSAASGEPGLSEKKLKEFRRDGARRPKARDELRRTPSWAIVRTERDAWQNVTVLGGGWYVKQADYTGRRQTT